MCSIVQIFIKESTKLLGVRPYLLFISSDFVRFVSI